MARVISNLPAHKYHLILEWSRIESYHPAYLQQHFFSTFVLSKISRKVQHNLLLIHHSLYSLPSVAQVHSQQWWEGVLCASLNHFSPPGPQSSESPDINHVFMGIWIWLMYNRKEWTSMPLTTDPKTTCLLSSQGAGAVVMKNWEPLVWGPLFAIETKPGLKTHLPIDTVLYYRYCYIHVKIN